jgi:cbb3-type cytochrome oxidase subunit 3
MSATDTAPVVSSASAITLVEIGLIVFLVMFAVIVVWVMLKKKSEYEKAKRIPLEDDVVTPRDQAARKSNGSAGAES